MNGIMEEKMAKRKKAAIVTGGTLDREFVDRYMEKERFDLLIAADAGLEYFFESTKTPDVIVGDFDSVTEETRDYFLQKKDIEVRQFDPHKDYTDTELAFRTAIEKKSDEIHLLAATGTRLDHMLGTVRMLGLALEEGIPAYMADPCNRLRLIDRKTVLKKQTQYGKYVSLIPLTNEVTGITLRGFEYPLSDFTMKGFQALGISNEIVEEEAVVELKSGILILVEAKDRN